MLGGALADTLSPRFVLCLAGFETSANFVEEQAPGVFVKTLRNMWFAVAFFNPVLSLLALFVLPLEGQDGIYNHTVLVACASPFALPSHTRLFVCSFVCNDGQGDLLAQMAHTAAGKWLKVWVAIDATVVLSGAAAPPPILQPEPHPCPPVPPQALC